jgi:hypothetical protein
MGDIDRNGDGVAARRELVERLRDEDDVREVNFSRDGFRTVVVELEPDADFRERWRRTATRLGYGVERPGRGDLASGRSANVWLLRLDDTESPAGPPTAGSTLRRAVARLRAFLDRLRGR